ncbi:hypothetical protein SB18R_17765 [Pseudomonas oryzihabitans]|nr:hypothetical protein SB9_13420 [Pseudomonas psychrotolerans]KTT73250.1 hypothetical protein SB18R_17765 [Pseudomonas psychrotolerans]
MGGLREDGAGGRRRECALDVPECGWSEVGKGDAQNGTDREVVRERPWWEKCQERMTLHRLADPGSLVMGRGLWWGALQDGA